MAKKQTRRSISVSRSTYERLKAFCETSGISMSQCVETQVGTLLGEEGAAPAPVVSASAAALATLGAAPSPLPWSTTAAMAAEAVTVENLAIETGIGKGGPMIITASAAVPLLPPLARFAIAMMLIFAIPPLYVTFQALRERLKPSATKHAGDPVAH